MGLSEISFWLQNVLLILVQSSTVWLSLSLTDTPPHQELISRSFHWHLNGIMGVKRITIVLATALCCLCLRTIDYNVSANICQRLLVFCLVLFYWMILSFLVFLLFPSSTFIDAAFCRDPVLCLSSFCVFFNGLCDYQRFFYLYIYSSVSCSVTSMIFFCLKFSV